MPITPESAGTVSSPNDLTEQTAGTTSSPNDLTEGTAGTVSSPNDLTEGTAGTVLSPNDLTEATAGAASSPNDLTEATAGAVASPNDLTEVTAAGFPRPFVPLLSLDFKNGLYMQQRTPRSISDVIVYNRASNASYLDSYLDIGGREKFIIREDWVGSVTNLVEYSEDFTVVDWGSLNVSVSAPSYKDPFGAFNATLVTEDSTDGEHNLYYNPGVTGDHVWSVYAKYNGRHLVLNNRAGSSSHYAIFDLLRGYITFKGGTDYLSSSMEHVGNGWFRIDLRFTDSTAHGIEFSLVLDIDEDESAPSYQGDNESGVYIFGAQCTQTERTTPYIKTTGTTVAQTFVEQPRFEVDALNGQPLGMLSENSATNLWVNSESFTNNLELSLSEGSEIAPDGTRTATLLVPNATSTNSHQISETVTLAPSVKYTFSFFAKAGSYQYVWPVVTLDDGASANMMFDLSDGSSDLITGSSDETGSRYYGDGWWRCWITFTNSASGANPNVARLRVMDDGTESAYSGDGVKGLYVWGAQMEANPYPTTYIRTEGGSATRVGDDGDPTAVNFYNPFDTYQNKDISIHCEFTADSAAYDDQFSNDIFNIGANTSNANRFRIEKSSDATSGGLYIVYGDGNDIVRPTTFDENISSITLVITAAKGVRFYIDGALDYESSSALGEGGPQLAEILTLFNNSTSAHIKRALFFGYALTTEEVAQL